MLDGTGPIGKDYDACYRSILGKLGKQIFPLPVERKP
jgi:hypothetical protein